MAYAQNDIREVWDKLGKPKVFEFSCLEFESIMYIPYMAEVVIARDIDKLWLQDFNKLRMQYPVNKVIANVFYGAKAMATNAVLEGGIVKNSAINEINDMSDGQIKQTDYYKDALANVAFSGVPISTVHTANTNTFNSSYSCMDAIEEIKKYKALMEDGTISSQEFDSKKKQLLRI